MPFITKTSVNVVATNLFGEKLRDLEVPMDWHVSHNTGEVFIDITTPFGVQSKRLEELNKSFKYFGVLIICVTASEIWAMTKEDFNKYLEV